MTYANIHSTEKAATTAHARTKQYASRLRSGEIAFKRRGRKSNKMRSTRPRATIQKTSLDEPKWAVRQIVGSVLDNGRLFYVVYWEDTKEPAGNLEGSADAAIAEFRFRHLL